MANDRRWPTTDDGRWQPRDRLSPLVALTVLCPAQSEHSSQPAACAPLTATRVVRGSQLYLPTTQSIFVTVVSHDTAACIELEAIGTTSSHSRVYMRADHQTSSRRPIVIASRHHPPPPATTRRHRPAFVSIWEGQHVEGKPESVDRLPVIRTYSSFLHISYSSIFVIRTFLPF